MLQTTTLLRDSPLFSTFAVPDVEVARRFYRDTLGLDVRDGRMQGLIEIWPKEGQPITVYPKPDHQPAVFTVLNFPVDDIDQAVDALTAAGVTFEHYDNAAMKTDAKGVARGEGPAIAWFKDPAGNILSLMARA